jgi:hypothetical protein|tara:strand:- start:278 stop:499 length:222 start_codon:yes stop_codon:yes gene_type:complete
MDRVLLVKIVAPVSIKTNKPPMAAAKIAPEDGKLPRHVQQRAQLATRVSIKKMYIRAVVSSATQENTKTKKAC